jgi:LacI family transcriptional regulator
VSTGPKHPDATRKPPSLYDVAAASGVHYSTVSRVLSNTSDRPVAEDTRLKVLAAARSLGYRPNAMARGLRTARTATLGMMIPTFRNPLWAEVTRGAFRRAWEVGLVLVVVEDQETDDVEPAFERLVRQSRIDGLLVASYRAHQALGDRYREGVPTVFVGRQKVGSDRNVTLDEAATGKMVGERIVALGHRNIAHITGPSDNDWLARRAVGFAAGCATAGVEPAIVHTSLDEEGGLTAAGSLLEQPERPTALFVTNFNQTFGVLAAIRRHGLRVPDDISVVTCDDDPVMAYLDPPITGVHRPLEELGAAAVDAVLGQLETGVHRDIRLTDPATIVERASLTAHP